MSMTFSEFRNIVSKKPFEPFWVSRYIFRHISVVISWILVHFHITANQTTYISFIPGLAGGLMFCWWSPETLIIGMALIYLWWLLDHSDGEIARYELLHLGKRPNLSGEYLDLLAHRWIQPFYHICLGIGLMRITGEWYYCLLGTFAASNFVGFTRTQAVSGVFNGILQGKIDAANQVAIELSELSKLKPDKVRTGFNRLIDLAKIIKTYLSFPGCLLLLPIALVADIYTGYSDFYKIYDINFNMTIAYLVLQTLISFAQNITGTFYIAYSLKKLP